MQYLGKHVHNILKKYILFFVCWMNKKPTIGLDYVIE